MKTKTHAGSSAPAASRPQSGSAENPNPLVFPTGASPKPQKPPAAEKSPVTTASSHSGNTPPRNPGHPVQKVNTAFRLFAPSGKSVKLAADFTDWERHALSLERDQNGVWEIKVPLRPGKYAYRFLVDGQWQDDPQCKKREPNPFGTTNAIAHVG